MLSPRPRLPCCTSPACLDSVNPAKGALNGSLLTLHSFRMLCVLAAVLLPLFGWLYHASGLPVVDPLRSGSSSLCWRS